MEKFDNCTINARVQGSTRIPYKITIGIPRFSDKEIDTLIDALEQEPLLMSKLMNHELDPKVMQLAKSLGIHLFPERWNDQKMNCSCPDWAVPCKQHQNVIVHRFITKNTFEEQSDRMIQKKRHLADMTVATGENWIGNLSNQELNEIFR